MDSTSLLKDNDKRGTVGQRKTLTVKKFFNGKPRALNGGKRSKKPVVSKDMMPDFKKLLFAAVLRIAANYCFHGSSLLTAVIETQV